ncbi:MAG: FAD-dependent oxidoreductase [Clostridia bacterium]|nr:FAD-dependent oxidoreductase [Clostridia bacterium]
MTDIIVVGGGTAGLTAAVYARRSGKSVILIEKESTGGQIVFSPRVENYPGIPSVSGTDYASALTAQAESLGVAIEYTEALSVEGAGGSFTVRCDSGLVTGKALVIASGTEHRKMGLENEDDLIGCGVSYCAVCDGAFCSGREVAVVGGGNTALTDALFLSGICKKVTLIHRRDSFRAEDALVSRFREKPNAAFMMSCTIKELRAENGMLCGITLKNVKTREEQFLPVDGLFTAIGQVPRTDIFRGFVAMDEEGYIRAGEDCRTDREGVFVAGDCRTKAVRQLVTAAADGAAAGLGASRYTDSI